MSTANSLLPHRQDRLPTLFVKRMQGRRIRPESRLHTSPVPDSSLTDAPAMIADAPWV